MFAKLLSFIVFKGLEIIVFNLRRVDRKVDRRVECCMNICEPLRPISPPMLCMIIQALNTCHLDVCSEAADNVPALRPQGVQLLAGAGDHSEELGQRPGDDHGVRHLRLLCPPRVGNNVEEYVQALVASVLGAGVETPLLPGLRPQHHKSNIIIIKLLFMFMCHAREIHCLG